MPPSPTPLYSITTKTVYKYSFFPLTIVQWNRLPDSVVSLPQLDPFKVAVSGIHLKPYIKILLTFYLYHTVLLNFYPIDRISLSSASASAI